ncbi:MAG: hypothetical protein K0Q73_8446 [Paenibacillus sp.]|jgi:thiol-disulfide isomerase/thioredoxin|nr:hypothetical protein [Paenibacillus sp.]
MSIFRQLFHKDENAKIGTELEALQTGTLFPFDLFHMKRTNEETVFGFLSFSCAHCIDLLPYIGKLADDFEGRFVLITDGEENDNYELVNHFEYRFKVLSWRKSFGSIGVRSTPAFYCVDKAGYIAKEQIIRNSHELLGLFKG